MDRYRRIHEILSRLTAAREPVPTRRLLDELECSRHTLYRCIETARTYTGAPVVYDAAAKGWKLDPRGGDFQLPPLWFGPGDVLLLLSLRGILERLAPGFLRAELKPFEARLESLLDDEHLGAARLVERVKFIPSENREPPAGALRTCAEALAAGHRLRLRYHGRERDAVTERTVSPQHLVRYRDAWYLDAWCHAARGLRTFSVDRIREAALQKEPAKRIAKKTLETYFGEAYGIFAGPARAVAVLRFTPEHARWVSEERWHPRQESRFLPDGSYELSVPYGDDRELLLDILRHGPQVEVIAPVSLRRAAAKAHRQAAALYQSEPADL